MIYNTGYVLFPLKVIELMRLVSAVTTKVLTSLLRLY